MVGQIIFKEIRRLFNFNQFKDYEEEKSFHGWREDADFAWSRTKWHVSSCRKYEIAQSLYYHWKNKFDYGGIDGLQKQYKRIDPDIRELEKENDRLKKIIARQALEIEIKSELLKKRFNKRDEADRDQ